MNIKISFEQILVNANDSETNLDFRTTCLLCENQISDWELSFSQGHKENPNDYHQNSSLYLTEGDNNRTKLIIYDTEIEKEEVKLLGTLESLDWGTCITQLPNGELFCYGRSEQSGTTLIIDKNYEIRNLLSGAPCRLSIGIYFNGSVYFFGGWYMAYSSQSRRFDLNENRWVDLNRMPKPDWLCHSVIFKGNILFSGCFNVNLLLYSIDIDSFSTIPYKFWMHRKILAKAERLYVFEVRTGGFIYESEAEDIYHWNQISSNVISGYPNQVYCSYNKGGIYIAISGDQRSYYKFDLNQKIMIKLQ